jgi:translation initiation factor IF-2
MAKVRVYEIAREVGLDSKVLVEKLQEMGFEVKSHASALEEFEARDLIEKMTAARKANVVEKRIGNRVIRRRPKAAPAEPAPEADVQASEDDGEDAAAAESTAADADADETQVEAAVATAADDAQETAQQEEPVAPEVEVQDHAQAEAPGAEEQAQASPAKEDKSTFYQAKIIRRATPPETAKVQATVVSRPPPAEAAKPTGVRVLKVVPGKEGRGNQFIDVSSKQDKDKRKRTSRSAKTDVRNAMFDGFTPGYTPGMTRRRRLARSRGGRKTQVTTPKALKRIVKMEASQIAASDLAKRMGIKLREVNLKLREFGEEIANLNDDRMLDLEIASMVAQAFEHEVQDVTFKEGELLDAGEDNPEELTPKPAVVTVMGHVDHGKTSILDAIRKTKVTAGEAGGITQHIGAYEVQLPKGTISFIDTPGHEAFTAMRARGASITDIVVLVVAADDGIMPQTIEAIHHAKDAGVPIMVAVNKIDLPDANSERIRQDLTKFELVPEEWGGDTIVTEVSAKTGQGLDKLLENILLQAEVMELKANENRPATGHVVEARLDRGRGPVATLLVQAGTLNKGDTLLIGTAYGRLRMMYDHEGKVVDSVTPGRPVQIQGLNEVPMAGEEFFVVKNEREAKKIIDHRKEQERVAMQGQTARLSLEDFYEQLQGAEKLELKVLVKADVQGSAEAVRQALEKLASPKVGVKVIHHGVGAISETDVNLASASNAILVGFNIRPDPNAKKLAQKLGLEIRLYTIIYNMTEEIRQAQEGLLPAMTKENVIGRAEVRDLFVVPKLGTVAGVSVVDGKMVRNSKVRLLRDSVEVYNGKLISLKRFKDDAREVTAGYECGIGLDGFNDIKRGDVVEAYVLEEQRQTI